MDKIKSFKDDIAELESLSLLAQRPKVKDLLTIEARRLSTEILKLEEQCKDNPATTPDSTTSNAINTSKRYQYKLSTYAWDQTSSFVKFYVTLKDVQTIAPENVICTFTNNSLELNVKDLNNKDYYFTIKNLLKSINPEKSTWRLKTDTVLINAAKIEHSNWSHVTNLEKKASDAKAPKKVDKEDPSGELMSVMKKLYDDGDDEMKRTIAKAWTESQNKLGTDKS